MHFKNRGEMNIKTGVDWFGYSAGSGTNFDEVLTEPFKIGEIAQPQPYYNRAVKLCPSGRIDWNTVNLAQGIKVTYTGSDIRILEESGISISEIAEYVTKGGVCKMTRIDLAVDMINEGVNITELHEAFQRGEVKTRAKSCNLIEGFLPDGRCKGRTFTVGNRQSEIYPRVYDKALEQWIKNHDEESELTETIRELDWKRMELEIKGDKAQLAAKGVAYAGVPQTINSTLARFMDFPTVEWWQEMVKALPSADLSLMQGINHNAGKSDRWLKQQALPAVIKAIESGDVEVIYRVKRTLDDYRNSGEQIEI